MPLLLIAMASDLIQSQENCRGNFVKIFVQDQSEFRTPPREITTSSCGSDEICLARMKPMERGPALPGWPSQSRTVVGRNMSYLAICTNKTSFLFLVVRHLFLVAWHLFLLASCYY